MTEENEPPVTEEEYKIWWNFLTARERITWEVLGRIVPVEPYVPLPSYEEWCRDGRQDEKAIRQFARDKPH
jgi:hypothetical protein